MHGLSKSIAVLVLSALMQSVPTVVEAGPQPGPSASLEVARGGGWDELEQLLNQCCPIVHCRSVRVPDEASALALLDMVIEAYAARGVNPNATTEERDAAKAAVVHGHAWLDAHVGWLQAPVEADFITTLDGIMSSL